MVTTNPLTRVEEGRCPLCNEELEIVGGIPFWCEKDKVGWSKTCYISAAGSIYEATPRLTPDQLRKLGLIQ